MVEKVRDRQDFLKTDTWPVRFALKKLYETRVIWYPSFEAMWTSMHPPKTKVNYTFPNVRKLKTVKRSRPEGAKAENPSLAQVVLLHFAACHLQAHH